MSDYQQYDEEDLKNISFCKNITESQITNLGFIKSFGNCDFSYAFAHDYLADVSKLYCKSHTSFSEIMAENIEFYREHRCYGSNKLKKTISKRFKNYYSDSSERLINVF